jgi:hypothetical protein
VGLTYGGNGLCGVPRMSGEICSRFDMSDGAPSNTEITTDATWDGRNVYSYMLTMHGASIAHGVKKMHLIVDSSMESEAVGTGKAGELIAYAREVMRGLCIAPQGPTFLGTNNRANMLIASGRALPARSKHCLRRYTTFLERVKMGDCVVGRVKDKDTPSDFLTKFLVSKGKFTESVDYATNKKNMVPVI